MVFRATGLLRRVGALIAVGATVSAGAIVPTSVAHAVGSPQHEPGLYVSIGGSTQLNRGHIDADGALSMDQVGAPSPTSYNALAAHLPTSSLYAIANGGKLLRVLNDGSVEGIERPDGSPVNVGGSRTSAAFGGGAYEDHLYYNANNTATLGCFNVVTRADCGTVTLSKWFTPVDMTWSDGSFWGLQGTGTNAKLTRLTLDGTQRIEVETAPIPELDESKVTSGSYGAAWTFGNGNLGFLSSGGGSVQLKILSADPIVAEVVGYSGGPGSNQLDGAMIPESPGDVELSVSSDWTGAGDAHLVTATVRNVGVTPVTGYQLLIGPDSADTRPIVAPLACTPTAGSNQCIGGALQPGEHRSLQLELGEPADPAILAASWSASVELNEVDTNPANNSAIFSPSMPAPVDVQTEVKARVSDTNNDGAASPGEKMEVFVVVANNSAQTLSNVSVQLDTIFPQAQELAGQIPPGARRTIRFVNEVPDIGPEGEEFIVSSLNAVANGTPVNSLSSELIVLGEVARPVIKQPSTPVAPPAAPSVDADSTAGVGAHSDATGDGGAASAPGSPEATVLSATGSAERSPAFAVVGLCLMLALAVGGAGLRRSRRRVNE